MDNTYNNIQVSEAEVQRVELYSEEYNDIMGAIPSRITRYGTMVVAVVLVLAFVGSLLFKYPDIIQGNFYVVSEKLPVAIKAKKSGKLVVLFAADTAKVEANEIIGVMEDAANYHHILWLDSNLNRSTIDKIIAKDLTLGGLQVAYSELERGYLTYLTFQKQQFHKKKINTLEKRKEKYLRFIAELNISKKLSDSLLSISNENYRSDSILFSNKSISPLEFRQSQSQMIKLKQEQQDVNVSIATAQLEFNAIEEQLIEAKNMRIEKDKALSLELNNAMERLKGEIYVWKEKNTLVSPIAGRVTYSRIWGENQFVNQDQTVCNVVPEATSKVIGKINVPVQNSGKVKTGQRVNLKFNNFPHKEFGFIETNLEQISLIPDSFYVATVVLPDTLLTNYGLVIPFSQNMQGRAEIITENRSLFLRIISPIKSVLKERM